MVFKKRKEKKKERKDGRCHNQGDWEKDMGLEGRGLVVLWNCNGCRCRKPPTMGSGPVGWNGDTDISFYWAHLSCDFWAHSFLKIPIFL